MRFMRSISRISNYPHSISELGKCNDVIVSISELCSYNMRSMGLSTFASMSTNKSVFKKLKESNRKESLNVEKHSVCGMRHGKGLLYIRPLIERINPMSIRNGCRFIRSIKELSREM